MREPKAISVSAHFALRIGRKSITFANKASYRPTVRALTVVYLSKLDYQYVQLASLLPSSENDFFCIQSNRQCTISTYGLPRYTLLLFSGAERSGLSIRYWECRGFRLVSLFGCLGRRPVRYNRKAYGTTTAYPLTSDRRPVGTWCLYSELIAEILGASARSDHEHLVRPRIRIGRMNRTSNVRENESTGWKGWPGRGNSLPGVEKPDSPSRPARGSDSASRRKDWSARVFISVLIFIHLSLSSFCVHFAVTWTWYKFDSDIVSTYIRIM